MQKISDNVLIRIHQEACDDMQLIRAGGSLVKIDFAKNEKGETLTGDDLIRFVAELWWKSKMFDEFNQGFSAIDLKTGEKIGPCATQIELANRLNKSAVVISRYFTGMMVSKKYKFIKEPYYKSFLTDPEDKGEIK